MDHQITNEDREFMRWLESKECERYWDTDENGEKVILRSGWDRAYEEYNRIKESLAMNLKKDLKE
jgi:hypothetical protein